VIDPYNLKRFVQAQSHVFEKVCAELQAGRKRTCWMWFIFPQFSGLGTSYETMHFAISSGDEAVAYLANSLLGPRLRQCTRLVNSIEARSVTDIFGFPDNLKFRSSMTLFASVSPEDRIFDEALRRYFLGRVDEQTLLLLRRH
jgi:uncharacterized protein (DUF1810 family)